MFKRILKAALAMAMCTTTVFSTYVATPVQVAAESQAPIMEVLQNETATVDNGTGAFVGTTEQANAMKALDNFSLNAKIKVTGTSTVQTVFFVGNGNKNPNYVSVWLNKNNTVGVEAFNAAGQKQYGVSGTSTVAFNDGAEHNFTFTFTKGGKFVVYVDGLKGYEVAVSPAFTNGHFADDAAMYVGLGKGNRPNGGNNYPFTGTIRDVEVYDRALNENEVKAYAGFAQLVYSKGFFTGEYELTSEELASVSSLTKGEIVVRFAKDYYADEVILADVDSPVIDVAIFARENKVGLRFGPQEYSVNANIENDKWNLLTVSCAEDGSVKMRLNDTEFAADAFTGWSLPGFLSALQATSITTGNGDNRIESVRVYSAPLTDDEYETIFYEYGDPRDTTGKTGYLTEPIDLFYPGYDGSPAYRIPSLFTTMEGTVIGAIDQRNNGTPDNGNIDTILRRREKGQSEWSDKIEVIDLVDNNNSTPCAFLIDPAFVQDRETGRIFMIVDMFPESSGAMNTNILSYGDGHEEINGVKYQEVFQDGTKFGTIRDKGVVYDTNGMPTDYTVVTECEAPYKELGNTYYKGEYVGNAFIFSGANKGPLQIDRTMYIWMSYSDDDGKTWSCPKNISPMIKPDWALFQGVGPGVGLQLEDGTLTFPIYTAKRDLTPTQASAMIYSTDGGETWQMGESTVTAYSTPLDASTFSDSSKITTEAQAVQLNNGDVKIFMRNYSGTVRMATSKDGGKTWANMENTPVYDCYCQLTVQHYNNRGKEYVIMVNPGASGRNVGTVNIAEVDANGNLNWKYKRIIEPGRYLYSCLTLLDKDADGDQVFGLLYEHEPNNMYLKYVEFDEEWVMNHDAVMPMGAPQIVDYNAVVEGDKVTVTIAADQPLIIDPKTELGVIVDDAAKKLAYVGTDENGALVFEGTIVGVASKTILFNGFTISPENIKNEYLTSENNFVLYAPVTEEAKLSATVSAYTSQHSNSTAENTDGAASNVADSNPNTFWHSNYGAGYNLPQSVTLDLGEAKDIYKLAYLPRQNSNSGRVRDYTIEVSTDGTNFNAITTGTFETTTAKQFTEFAPTKARYVRFVVTSGVLSNCCTVAELEVYPYNEATYDHATDAEVNNLLSKIEEYAPYMSDAKYSEATREALTNVLREADALVNTTAPKSSSMVALVIAKLDKVAEALVDVTKATAAKAEAEALTQEDGPYTLLSWNEYTSAIANLDDIINNATTKRVNKDVEMKVAYATSLLKVTGAVDKTILEAKLNVAKAANTEGMTAESVKALNDAIAAAEAILAKEKPTQDEIDAAVITLTEAIDGLAQRALNEDKLINKTADSAVHVESCDSQYTGETADKTLDHNNNTIWHSDWSGSDKLPISITYDLGATYSLSDLTFLGRQNGSINGDIFEFDLYVGDDVNNLTLVKHVVMDTTGSGTTETLANKSEFQRVMFEATGLFVNMTVTRSGSDNASKANYFASMAEIRFYEAENATPEVPSVDKTALEALVDYANELDPYGYKDFMPVMDALFEASGILAKENATQAEVDAALEALQAAIDALEENAPVVTVDKAALNEAIAAAEALAEADYSRKSWPN